MDIIGKLLQGKKTYITTLIASCDEFFTCFLFFFLMVQGIYYVQQIFVENGFWCISRIFQRSLT